MIGGLGADTISGDDGHDVILGDAGLILRATTDDGSPRINANGSWHRDVLLEDVGVITAVVDMDTTPLSIAELARLLFLSDLVVLAGAFGADGLPVETAGGAWATVALFVNLVAADDDVISGGAGDLRRRRCGPDLR